MATLNKLRERKNSMDKRFRHCFLEEYHAYNVDSDDGRYYVTPDGNFPSVTSFLGALETDRSWLDKWADKLGGKDKAEIELNRCADRGTGVHLALENLLKNEPNPEVHAGDYKFMYRQIQTVMNIHVDDVYGLETPLWSNTLGLAGRVDCIAKYKGRIAIIDFKTSTNPKRVDWISSYFEQATCYAIMLNERYGIKAEQIVIVIATEKGGTDAQVFVRDPRDYYVILSEHIKEFRRILEDRAKYKTTTDCFSMF